MISILTAVKNGKGFCSYAQPMWFAKEMKQPTAEGGEET